MVVRDTGEKLPVLMETITFLREIFTSLVFKRNRERLVCNEVSFKIFVVNSNNV